MSLTKAIAEYALNKHLTCAEMGAFRTALLDWMAAGIASKDEQCVQLLKQLQEEQPPADSYLVLGQKERYSLRCAALINGTASHAQDFDDIHLNLSLHLTSPVFGAAFTVVQHYKTTWDDFSHAVSNGMQVMTALGVGIMPEHYKQRWHSSATLGVFGATTAAGYLLDLTTEQMCHAYGLAAALAGGLQQNFGAMAKPIQVGYAAAHGVEAAKLAKLGVTAHESIFDTEYLEMYSPRVNREEIRATLESSFAVTNLCFKQFPCGIPTHAGIINIQKLKKAHGLTVEDIEKVLIETTSHGKRMTGRPDPKGGLEGKFSIQFCAAASFLTGKVNADTFTDEMVAREDIRLLMKKIELVVNDDLPEHSLGTTTIRCKNGSVYTTKTTNIRRGKTPDEQADLAKEKFLDVVGRAYGKQAAALDLFVSDTDFSVSLKNLFSTLGMLS